MFRVAIIFLFFSFRVSAEDNLVPSNFLVPVEKKMSEYVFLKVDPKYSELDFNALMSSRFFIREQLKTDWPSDTFTLEENTETLVSDLKSFELKSNFTFHIFNKSRTQIIGCFYISSTTDSNYDAAVFVWVKEEYLSSDIFRNIKLHIQSWILNAWPFEKVDYSLNKT